MIQESYPLWTKEEYSYAVVGEFIPNVVTYIHDDNQERPAIIVVPGGAYCAVSPTEGEIVAKEFYNKGYNAFVVTYTTNLLMDLPLKLQPLKDLSKAVMLVRKNAKYFRIQPNRVVICGFSAGGHLCGSLAVHYSESKLQLGEEYMGVSNRPDAVILSYPVITSGEKAHRDSFTALLGADATEEDLEFMSVEKQVTKDTPPIFLWHTATDEAVPVENSTFFADACKEHGVPYELHVFAKGPHGMSLANEEWASGAFGGDYTLEQLFEVLQYRVDNHLELPAPYNAFGSITETMSVKEAFRQSAKLFPKSQPDEGVAIWPELAHHWLKRTFV